jgi:glycine/D-amino acid oxidase-like deaminating enzyme
MNNTHDILIIGGGIFGLTAALSLKERGHRVMLCDAGPIPHPLAASTDISKVVRVDYGGDELYTALAEEARQGWLRWNESWGEPLYHEQGVTMLSRGPLRPGDFVTESYHLLKERGHPLQRLDGAAIARRFPAWNADLYNDGYFNPHSGFAESGRVVATLAWQAQAAGVDIRTEQPIQALLEENGRVVGVTTAHAEELRADLVIVAAGAWIPVLLSELRGMMRAVGLPVFHLKPTDPTLFQPPNFYTFSADITRSGWYGFPVHPRESVIKLAFHGQGREIDPAGDERKVTPDEIEALRRFLAESLPALAQAPLVYTRLCLYCDVPDGHFWIDRHPHKEGLAVAGGGSGHAFKFAPVLGDLIADVAEQKTNPYLERFGWRTLQAGVTNQEATRYAGQFDG